MSDFTKAFLSTLSEERHTRISAIYDFIIKMYPDIDIVNNFSPKVDYPVFKIKNSDKYVAISSPKSYISIHFSDHEAPKIISSANNKIKTGVGCVKIPDKVDFPIKEIENAIRKCLG